MRGRPIAPRSPVMLALDVLEGRVQLDSPRLVPRNLVKGPKAKPGKRAPTKDERAWMDAVAAYGCIACRMDGRGFRPAAVHHILRGGLRIGHRFTIGLCDPGHHQGGQPLGLISRHPWKTRFERRYGTEMQLLAHVQRVLKKQPDGSYAP